MISFPAIAVVVALSLVLLVAIGADDLKPALHAS